MKTASSSDFTDIAGQQPRKTYCLTIQMVFMSLYIVHIDSCETLKGLSHEIDFDNIDKK